MGPRVRQSHIVAALWVTLAATGVLWPARALAQTPPRTVGDVTRDGSISAADALAILDYVVGNTLPGGFVIDPDGDAACLVDKKPVLPQPQQAQDEMVYSSLGPISAADALAVLRYVVSLPTDHTCVGYQDSTRYTMSWSTSETDTLAPVGYTAIARPQVYDTTIGGYPGGVPWIGFNPDTLKLEALMRISVSDPGVVNVDTMWLFPLSPIIQISTKAPGTTQVIAKWFDKQTSITFRVADWVPQRMSMSVPQIVRPGGTVVSSFTPGDTARVSFTAYDSLPTRFGGNFQKPLGADSVTLTSSNPSVATIDAAGLVTGVAPGTAMIKASWSGLSDSTFVTVLSNAAAIENDESLWFKNWYGGTEDYYGPGLFLSNAAFQHTAPWSNAGMEFYGRIPRVGVVNNSSDPYFNNISRPWDYSYRVLLSAASALKMLTDPAVVAELGAANVARDQAYARFMQGLAHATLAVLYDQGFVVDENTDVSLLTPGSAVDYNTLMSSALSFFDQAIALAGANSFSFPYFWMQANVTSDDLVRLAHSMKARYRTAVARTPAERASEDWAATIADVDAGLSSSFVIYPDPGAGWGGSGAVLYYGNLAGWSEAPYWMYGMADQSGAYQTWIGLALASKTPNPAGLPSVLIVTPDLRFPQDSTVAGQQLSPGTYLENPADIASVWTHPERGTWRWSYYRNRRFSAFTQGVDYSYAEVNVTEMQLLKAEGLYREGDLAGAASIINVTRTGNGGLSATDASGTNTSCVPKLPSGACGDLWEMLKWEKRLEVYMQGLFGAPWYFDSRGWGDLFVDTPLELPAPCQVFDGLPLLTCNTYGGGGPMSAPVSTYHFPDEGG